MKIFPTHGDYSLKLFLFVALIHLFLSNGDPTNLFNELIIIGNDTRSNEEPIGIIRLGEGMVLVGGTTSPENRGEESNLGEPMMSGLRQEDIFITKAILNDTKPMWTYRIGTAHEDRLNAMLLDADGRHVYLGGRTFGQFEGTVRKGQADIVIIKVDISGNRPVQAWKTPLVIGTPASDAVTELIFSPNDTGLIYATGFTSGNLFQGLEYENYGADAILFSFSSDTGNVIDGIQFGTENADYGARIVTSSKSNSPIFVAVTTERQIGQYTFGNFHLYKFDRNLTSLGRLLLKTFSREQLSSFIVHPKLSETLLSSGSSWLEAKNGFDVFVKRIITPFDDIDIGEREIDIDEVDYGEYTKRYQSSDGSHDYCSGALVDPDSGRLVLTGYTAGSFASGSSKKGILTPFVASVDPVDGEMTDIRQLQLEKETDWVEISSSTLTPTNDGIYYAAKESNANSSQFFAIVGKFTFPQSWKNEIKIPITPSPTPPPVLKGGESSALSDFPIFIVVGAVCGGVILVAIIFAIARYLQVRARSKAARIHPNVGNHTDPGQVAISYQPTKSEAHSTPTVWFAGTNVVKTNSSALV